MEDDLLQTLDVHDSLNGNQGNDTPEDGNGDDDLFGRTNDGLLYGGPGTDTLRGKAGHDVLKWSERDFAEGLWGGAPPRTRP
ncbi:hypothetical protein [Jannaschia seohaensis]|uniref:Hemolysin type calcium-binding protein n=1 Tax=Jannaschia seohaensis TaxID=475081 RepID=A0A2Y9AYR4_9RHOB|nr:hypothetical protein [Jannaschia seohaensis]PWJ16130.1 hypothetical protein BCF38_10914 [Jannaschia seohaensis]SSA49005.1 hypothetical protein SAMN05421539_10914 [Jannaschia seohaensis]